MEDAKPPESISVPLSALINLAVEQARLANWLAANATGAGAGPARHAIRKLEEFLQRNELSVQSLDGRPHDPGLAAQVIDVVEDPSLPPGQAIIDQTLSPMVLWRGQVVRPAEVVMRQNRASSK